MEDKQLFEAVEEITTERLPMRHNVKYSHSRWYCPTIREVGGLKTEAKGLKKEVVNMEAKLKKKE